jgi:DNA-directed RNA polymerase subunit RPC12/RpoP
LTHASDLTGSVKEYLFISPGLLGKSIRKAQEARSATDGASHTGRTEEGGTNMKENTSKHKEKSGSRVKNTVAPEFLTTCPACGGEIELWSGTQETVCIFCQHKVFDKETTVH